MNHVLGKKSGTKFALDPRALIGQGVEGRVYRSGKGKCVKIFTVPMTDESVGKVNALIGQRRKLPGFAWPSELVVDPVSRKPVGFAMDFVDGTNLETLMDDHATGKISKLVKVQLAIQVVQAVALAHSSKGPRIVLGDVIKSGNFVIDGSKATFVDTATLSLFGFRSPDGKVQDSIATTMTRVTSPKEVLENPSATPSQSADLFAVGVLLFELFFGRPPHEPRPCPESIGLEPNEAVRKGIYPRWISSPTFEPPAYDDIATPPAIDDLFRAVFLSSAVRPSASEWLAELEAYLDQLTPKPVKKFRIKLPQLAEWQSKAYARLVEIEPTLIAWFVLAIGGCGAAWAAQTVLHASTLVEAKRIEKARRIEFSSPPPVEVGPPLFRELFR